MAEQKKEFRGLPLMKMMANDIKLEEEINHQLSPYLVLYYFTTK